MHLIKILVFIMTFQNNGLIINKDQKMIFIYVKHFSGCLSPNYFYNSIFLSYSLQVTFHRFYYNNRLFENLTLLDVK